MPAVIQPGDFAVIPVSGPAGTLISIGEWLNGSAFSHYDHAEIYVGMPDIQAPCGYTIGAYPGGARAVPVPENQHGWLWSSGRIGLSDAERAAIVQAAIGCKGTGYSAADYLALAAHRFHVPWPGLKDYVEDSGRMICSQLTDYCYCRAGVHLFTDGRWPGYVTPADLAYVIGHPEGIVHA